MDDDLRSINWGIKGNKLQISPKFIKYINTLTPGPDRDELMSLFEIVHQLSDMIDDSEPNDMKEARYQPAVTINAPYTTRDGKISGEGIKEFCRALAKHHKDEGFKGSHDYKALMALGDMANNPVGEKPVWYKLIHTIIPVGNGLVDYANGCKLVKYVNTFADLNHYQIIFKMNTGKLGTGCLDIESKTHKRSETLRW